MRHAVFAEQVRREIGIEIARFGAHGSVIGGKGYRQADFRHAFILVDIFFRRGDAARAAAGA